MEIVEDTKYLKSVDDIENYFKDCGHEYFDCGQGYFDEEVSKFVKVDNEYFVVTMTAEIESSKQDRGDRLYFVECISSVTYKPISIDEIKETLNKNTLNKIASFAATIKKLQESLL
jgi:hypothetical protein